MNGKRHAENTLGSLQESYCSVVLSLFRHLIRICAPPSGGFLGMSRSNWKGHTEYTA